MATPGNKYVVLECPYGSMRPACSLEHICNGAKGQRQPGGVVVFEGHGAPVIVPEHWLADDTDRMQRPPMPSTVQEIIKAGHGLAPERVTPDSILQAAIARIETDAAYARTRINALEDIAAEYRALIGKLRDALGTEEYGEALVDVARAAHKAEMELAALYKAAREHAIILASPLAKI